MEPVAIVHDWLMSMRGGERVVEVLLDIFPRADLFTLTWDPARLSPMLARRAATTSPIHALARAPFIGGRFRPLLPLFPRAIESFRLDRYALVVSSSHCVALGAVAPPGALHVAYVHSTLRYVHEAQLAYEASVPGGPVGRTAFRGVARYLRRWEAAAAARPDALLANSTYTRERIRSYYGRDAQVIAPPIETGRFERAAAGAPATPGDAPFLLVSALVPNKRVDLALRAFQGRPERLVVVGEGPERGRLERLLGPNVTLLPRVDDARLAELYAGCRALLHTAVDDFGMVMVEAMAAGKPVLACAQGGALDIVEDGENGLRIDAPTVDAVRAALDRFARLSGGFEPSALQRFARRFDRAHFERRFLQSVEEAARARRDARSNGARGSAAHTSGAGAHAAGTNGASTNGASTNGASTNGASRTANGASSHARPPNGHAVAAAGVPAVPGITAVPSVPSASPAGLALKRALDVALAASGLLVSAPLVAALAALIPLDSPGPALFRQRRTGLDQRPFTMIKLRTMDAQGRVTRVGRLLRPTGLDELPQLWNVLKGDMSLIGPRPEVLERVPCHEADLPHFGARHQIRPGITGWAQVNGLRGNVSIAERLRFDLQYVKERSLALDGRILVRTVSTVVSDTLRELRG
jgi:lipopolysaccharide/colanic/teichoic acid biosynthesis glycosyltransferase/glycosyltransferase involved in cell wall biosynthesis